MSESKKIQAVKVVLSSGKVVVLREMRISDTDTAAQAAAQRANGDSALLQILMQRQLVSLLLLQVDGKPISAADREDLDGLFKVGEYTQVMKIIGKMSGAEEAQGKLPAFEMVSV